MKVGSAIRYVDPHGVAHDALVTARHDGKPQDSDESISEQHCINLVYVSENLAERDQYGRQIKRESSVQAKASTGAAHGRYWQPRATKVDCSE